MVISDEKKIIFFHIAKCAGTSVEDFLFHNKKKNELYGVKNINGEIFALQHLTYQKLKELNLIGNRLQEYYKFTVVRNPYARTVSDYLWLIRKKQKEFNKISFPDFIQKVKQIVTNKKFYQKNYYDHFIPQSNYLVDSNNNEILNEIIKIENLDDYFLKNYGVKPVRKNTRNKYKYLSYYNPDTIKIINDLYHEDFEKLNYPMIQPNELINYKKS